MVAKFIFLKKDREKKKEERSNRLRPYLVQKM